MRSMVSEQMLKLQRSMQQRAQRIKVATYADDVVIKPALNNAFIVEVLWNNRKESTQYCVSPAMVFGTSERSSHPTPRMTACQLMRTVIAKVLERRL